MKNILMLLLIVSCNISDTTAEKEIDTTDERKIDIIAEKEIDTNSIRYYNAKPQNFDSIKMKSFIEKFIASVSLKDTTFLFKHLSFPLDGIDIPSVTFAATCDSSKYVQLSEKFDYLKIDRKNLMKYYSDYFNTYMISTIKQISFDSMIAVSENTGYSLLNSYNVVVDASQDCSNNAALVVNLFYLNNEFHISLSMCC